MKLIIGLGNPGKQYERTRHNVGFLFLERYKHQYDFSNFKLESKFKAEISSGRYKGEKTLLIKPQTYMNLSGEAIQSISSFYKISIDECIIIYDDKDMEFGKIRFRGKGSAGGHNGIKSIIKYFGENFKRIKVGVGYDARYDVSDWVLGNFSLKEMDQLEGEVYEKIEDFLQKSI